ncbi:hypothetical protein, partial [Pseudenhygromyxa sp. WMMC2535]|uniref:hypothetical protein n=1 Tax=Pseudenhygromyxa sp. WMMC2535 TaxID=2712867 RepID=UPI001C3C8A2C
MAPPVATSAGSTTSGEGAEPLPPTVLGEVALAADVAALARAKQPRRGLEDVQAHGPLIPVVVVDRDVLVAGVVDGLAVEQRDEEVVVLAAHPLGV